MLIILIFSLLSIPIYVEMSRDFHFLAEEDIQSLLEWDTVFEAIKQVMKDVSRKNATNEPIVIQPPRTFMHIPHKKGVLLTMPSLNERMKVFSCKLVTSFEDNPSKHGIPSILANILMFNPDTGKLKAILEGTTITEWRTAAASAVATQALKPNMAEYQTLAVFGAGRQGRSHIIAFKHFFKFRKINLWNRTYQNGLKLAEELKETYNIQVEVFSNSTDCAKDADVIVTATYASEPILNFSQLKRGVMINAVGAGRVHYSELDKSIYSRSSIYTDSVKSSRIELKGLMEEGFPILGEIGEIINGQKNVTNNDVIIFHSLGIALEDGATAQIILENYMKNKNVNV